MQRLYDSSDRRPSEVFLFALAFIGFGLGLTGTVLALPAVAVFGAVILLVAVSSFRSEE